MALTVEDGTGLAAADAFVSLVAFKTHADGLGRDYSSYSDTVIEQKIRLGTRYVSDAFRYKGHPVRRRDQALSWPRYDVYDEDGNIVASDEVPTEIRQATYEAAWYELTVGTLSPTTTSSERVKREKVGPLEVEYSLSSASASDVRPTVTSIRDILRGLTVGSGTYDTLLRV